MRICRICSVGPVLDLCLRLGRSAALVVSTLVLFACSGAVPDSATAIPTGGFETLVARGVAATLTADAPLPVFLPTAAAASSTPGAMVTATPGTPVSAPSAVPPTSQFFTDAAYALAEETFIGQYALRIWHNANSRDIALGADRIATLSALGQPTIQVDFFNEVDALSGTDITGDGTPEVILHTYTGGAHCCFGTRVVSLGPTAELVLDRPGSNCGSRFEDLDGDGVLEYQTCDDVFSYTFCPFAASPIVTVVMAYEPGVGYVPASPRFPEVYADDIARHAELAENGQPGELGEWDATTKCSVLPLVLAYLYSGQTERAWQELSRLYTHEDLEQFQATISRTVDESRLYVAPEDL